MQSTSLLEYCAVPKSKYLEDKMEHVRRIWDLFDALSVYYRFFGEHNTIDKPRVHSGELLTCSALDCIQ